MTDVRSVTLAELVAAAIKARLLEVHVSMPAKVLRYDKLKQLIDVQPLLKMHYVDEEGVAHDESMPPILNVPVCFPGAGGYRMTFPVVAGDNVCLFFAERSLDEWLAQGGEVAPIDLRDHSLTDAIGFLGLRPFNAPWSSAPLDKATFGKDGGPQVTVSDTQIVVDAPGADVKVNALTVEIGDGTTVIGIGVAAFPIARLTDAVQAGPFAGVVVGPGNPLVKG